MERSDFSVPRRMSKSAFIILLVKELLSYAGPFLIWAIIKLFNSGRQRSLMETMDAYSGGYPFSISGDIRSVPS